MSKFVTTEFKKDAKEFGEHMDIDIKSMEVILNFILRMESEG